MQAYRAGYLCAKSLQMRARIASPHSNGPALNPSGVRTGSTWLNSAESACIAGKLTRSLECCSMRSTSSTATGWYFIILARNPIDEPSYVL